MTGNGLLLGFVVFLCGNSGNCFFILFYEQGQNGSHFEPKPVAPPLSNKCDWEIEPSELDFSSSSVIGKVRLQLCIWL